MSEDHSNTMITLSIVGLLRQGMTPQEVRDKVDAVLEVVNAGRIHGGRCVHCGRWIIGWSDYQWSQFVAGPCPDCGRPW